MADYEVQFVELSDFAPAFVVDEKKKCQLFQHGLRLEIKTKTKIHNYCSFAELVVGAIRVEKIEKKFYNRK